MLRARILTALFGIPLILFFIYLGSYWYGLMVLIIALTGLKEYFFLIKINEKKIVKFWAYIFLFLSLLAVFLENELFILYMWFFSFSFFLLLPVFSFSKVNYWESALSYWGIIYTGGLASFLLAVRLLPDGFILTVFLFLIVWIDDILAFFVGSYWGKTPLAPKISPKKTWEGTVAGIIGSGAGSLLLSSFFSLAYLNMLTGFLLGIVVGTVAALGDLSQSSLKRSAGVKDSGTLLPGHGGILDRFDSLFLAAPFFYIFIKCLLP